VHARLLFNHRDSDDPFDRVKAAAEKLRGRPDSAAAVAEICIHEARAMEKQGDPARATGLYLAAIRSVTSNTFPAGNSRALALCNHATARAVELLAEEDPSWPALRRIVTPAGAIELHTRFDRTAAFNPRSWDTLQAADSFILDPHLFPHRQLRPGAGGTLVAYRRQTPQLLEEHPFLPAFGHGLPVTAIIAFNAENRAELTLHNAFSTRQIRLHNTFVPLAADFSAPIGALLSRAPTENIGFRGMLRPAAYFDLMGLYTLEPVRRDRIPLILVHGLNSRPATWVPTINSLLSDRTIRENYQLWYYRYPTGIPLAYSAAGLRRELDAIRDHYNITAANTKLSNIVMVGHSMGGLLASLQVRTSKNGVWNQYFSQPLETISIDSATRDQIEEMFLFDASPFITRVVFISTPHRGSPAALGPIGRLLASLIRFPSDIILARKPELLASARDLGRTLLTEQKNSVNNLREDNPTLQTILSLPLDPGVTIHSIIGDRGKKGPLEESSDGIVPYRSSHLASAVSERIVPAGHSAHCHPDAIAELRRILLQHLE
jgi:pimeloyl-ACP methyl ester carboxylesterase